MSWRGGGGGGVEGVIGSCCESVAIQELIYFRGVSTAVNGFKWYSTTPSECLMCLLMSNMTWSIRGLLNSALKSTLTTYNSVILGDLCVEAAGVCSPAFPACARENSAGKEESSLLLCDTTESESAWIFKWSCVFSRPTLSADLSLCFRLWFIVGRLRFHAAILCNCFSWYFP